MTALRRSVTALAIVLAAILVGGAATPPKPSARPSKQYTIEQFYATTGVRDASFSSDEKRMLFGAILRFLDKYLKGAPASRAAAKG